MGKVKGATWEQRIDWIERQKRRSRRERRGLGQSVSLQTRVDSRRSLYVDLGPSKIQGKEIIIGGHREGETRCRTEDGDGGGNLASKRHGSGPFHNWHGVMVTRQARSPPCPLPAYLPGPAHLNIATK